MGRAWPLGGCGERVKVPPKIRVFKWLWLPLEVRAQTPEMIALEAVSCEIYRFPMKRKPLLTF